MKKILLSLLCLGTVLPVVGMQRFCMTEIKRAVLNKSRALKPVFVSKYINALAKRATDVHLNVKSLIVPILWGQGNVENEPFRHCTTSLIEACFCGNKNRVKSLLKSGVDLDEQNNDGYTALMVASMHGNEDVVKLLLKSGASLNTKSDYGDTALDLARSFKNRGVEKILEEHC